jgi:hypothetical protein
VAAELGRPAAGNVAQDGVLLGSEDVVAQEGRSVNADDVRDLESRP